MMVWKPKGTELPYLKLAPNTLVKKFLTIYQMILKIFRQPYLKECSDLT